MKKVKSEAALNSLRKNRGLFAVEASEHNGAPWLIGWREEKDFFGLAHAVAWTDLDYENFNPKVLATAGVPKMEDDAEWYLMTQEEVAKYFSKETTPLERAIKAFDCQEQKVRALVEALKEELKN